jgi:23S rRNA pseudouridine1911/1915/1917 synthase
MDTKHKLESILKSKNASVIFEDDSILAIDKPPNFLVLPDRFDKTLPNLYNILRDVFGQIFIVHRIDKETSGIILFAKTPEAHAFLNAQFEQRTVSKTYKAIVIGTPKEKLGKIDLPLSGSKRNPGVMKIDRRHGKQSVTLYEVLEEFHGFALLRIKPESGRTHQIRVHLRAAGLPILCDKIYGDGSPFYLSSVKPRYYSQKDELGNYIQEKPVLARTALHAESITLSHPTTGNFLTLSAPIPKDMRSVINYLRKFKQKSEMDLIK